MNILNVYDIDIDFDKIKAFNPDFEKNHKIYLNSLKDVIIDYDIIDDIIKDVKYIYLMFNKNIIDIDVNILKMVKNHKIALTTDEAENIVLYIQSSMNNIKNFKDILKIDDYKGKKCEYEYKSNITQPNNIIIENLLYKLPNIDKNISVVASVINQVLKITITNANKRTFIIKAHSIRNKKQQQKINNFLFLC